MIRLPARLVAVGLACMVAGAFVPAARAAEDAQLGLVHISSNLGASVETFDVSDGQRMTLLPAAGQTTPVPFFLSPTTWSGDGRFLIAAALAKRSNESADSLYAVPAEGGSAVPIPGTSGALFPIGLPDGDGVAFERTKGKESESTSVEVGSGKRTIHRTHSRTSIWIAYIDGGKPRRLTPWRTDGYDILSSASPDGSTLAFTKVTLDRSKRPTRRHSEVRFLNLRTGSSVPVGRQIGSAAFSPDGTRLAVVIAHPFPRPHVRKTKTGTVSVGGETDIYIEDLATGALTQVTSGPGLDVDPAWDPSGQRLAFRRYGNPFGGEAAIFGVGDSIYEVNVDGSCLTRVLHEANGGFTAPAWRPGLDRGAGPISC